jgi:hypothetical protein
VIGLIVFRQKWDKDVVEGFGAIETAATISANNSKINSLLNKLQNLNPKVKLVNYNPQSVYDDLNRNITSNLSIVNNSINNLYDNSIKNNYKTIDTLENQITDIENIYQNMVNMAVNTKSFNTIKSLNNGLELNLVSTPNTFFQDERTGSNIAGYMVNVNNGCISVGATDYDIYQCNDKNPKQFFKMEHIMNETAYQNAIDNALPIDNTNKSSINYPFVMMKSLNNENCLTNMNGTLTVQPCYSFIAQRWIAL